MRFAAIALVVLAVMILGLIVATYWVEAHPCGCDAECRRRRTRQWEYLNRVP